MADYSCEWCSKENVCKYSYTETDCIPQKQVELASKVKIADIEDNMDLSRIQNPTDEDYKRVKKYEKARKELGGQ